MQGEIFFASESRQLLTPDRLAIFFTECGVPIHAENQDGEWQLVFDEAIRAYADLGINQKGEATFATVYIGRLRNFDDFRRINAGFRQLGWTYCDPSCYGTR